jgi:hypothetical protein
MLTLHPGANRLLLAPTDLMVGVLSACYTRRPQGVTHGQSRCTVLSVRRRVGRVPPQIPKLTVARTSQPPGVPPACPLQRSGADNTVKDARTDCAVISDFARSLPRTSTAAGNS